MNLLTPYSKWIDLNLQARTSPAGLGIFRIFFNSVLLAEVLQWYYFRHLIHDGIPYLQSAPTYITVLLLGWILAIICLIFGLFTRIAAVINYLLTVFFFDPGGQFEYHMFYAFISVNLIQIFLPLNNAYSIDNHLFSHPRANQKVSVLCYTLPLFLAVGLTYFDSALLKLTSQLWRNGLGLWAPASLPQAAQTDISIILNNEWLIKSLGYITILFELTLIFLIWFKRFRLHLLLVGVLLHIGILIVFPIPWFALGYLALYVLLLPPEKIEKIFPLSQAKRHVPPYLHFPAFHRLTIMLVHAIIALQIVFSVRNIQNITTGHSVLNRTLINKAENISARLIGITVHPLFMDFHFKNYDHVIGVKYIEGSSEQFIPIVSEKGLPGPYLKGFTWAFWSFRSNSPIYERNKLEKGIQRFTAFWLHRSGRSLQNARFEIVAKHVDNAFFWQKNFLKKQLEHKWINIGSAEWINEKFSATLPESLFTKTKR